MKDKVEIVNGIKIQYPAGYADVKTFAEMMELYPRILTAKKYSQFPNLKKSLDLCRAAKLI